MGALTQEGVAITFMADTGRFLARVEGPYSGNVLLRRAQHRASEDRSSRAALARSFVIGKVVNQRAVLRRALRDHKANMASADAVEKVLVTLTTIARRALNGPISTICAA